MPQRPLKMTAARAEKLFAIDIVDAPPPLQAEAVDRPPLAAVAPDPPIEPALSPAPVPQEEPAPAPPPAPPPTTAEEIEAAAFAAKKRSKGVPKRPAALRPSVPPPVATPPTDTRH